MGIIRITEKDGVTHISSDSVIMVQEYSDGSVTVTMKPIQSRSVDNPNLILDYCKVIGFQSIESVELFNV